MTDNARTDEERKMLNPSWIPAALERNSTEARVSSYLHLTNCLAIDRSWQFALTKRGRHGSSQTHDRSSVCVSVRSSFLFSSVDRKQLQNCATIVPLFVLPFIVHEKAYVPRCSYLPSSLSQQSFCKEYGNSDRWKRWGFFLSDKIFQWTGQWFNRFSCFFF